MTPVVSSPVPSQSRSPSICGGGEGSMRGRRCGVLQVSTFPKLPSSATPGRRELPSWECTSKPSLSHQPQRVEFLSTSCASTGKIYNLVFVDCNHWLLRMFEPFEMVDLVTALAATGRGRGGHRFDLGIGPAGAFPELST